MVHSNNMSDDSSTAQQQRHRHTTSRRRQLTVATAAAALLLQNNSNHNPEWGGGVHAFVAPTRNVTGKRRYRTSVMAKDAEEADASIHKSFFMDETVVVSSSNAAAPDNEDDNNHSDKLYNSQASKDSSPVSTASFGQVVSLKKPSTTSSSSDDLFGTSVPLTRPTKDATTNSVATAAIDEQTIATNLRRRNLGTAVVSIALAVTSWIWQFTHPLPPLALLSEMQQNSQPLSIIGRNDKPTVVDFWAPWCENCKVAASTLHAVEVEYGTSVNFVMVNGDLAANFEAIDAFGVDAIPHLAFVSATGNVETALIGPIPKHVLEANVDALVEAAAHPDDAVVLPYTMLDVFAGKPASARHVRFGDAVE